jgi:electron transfer flavoprotein beta subunit
VKRVIDPYVTVRIRSDHSAVEKENVKMAMNPFDEIAVEEAVKKKQQGVIGEVIVVSIGKLDSQETLRQALARGADKAYLIDSDHDLDPLHIAKILKKYVLDLQIDLVLLGKQAIDGDNNQTTQMLAALLGWGQGTFASSMNFLEDKKAINVTRELDGGLETINVMLPAVISVDLRLNQPSYISLPNVMKAKSKPLEIKKLNDLDLGIDLSENLKTINLRLPPKRKSGVILNSVAELIDKLKNEKGVI